MAAWAAPWAAPPAAPPAAARAAPWAARRHLQKQSVALDAHSSNTDYDGTQPTCCGWRHGLLHGLLHRLLHGLLHRLLHRLRHGLLHGLRGVTCKSKASLLMRTQVTQTTTVPNLPAAGGGMGCSMGCSTGCGTGCGTRCSMGCGTGCSTGGDTGGAASPAKAKRCWCIQQTTRTATVPNLPAAAAGGALPPVAVRCALSASTAGPAKATLDQTYCWHYIQTRCAHLRQLPG